MQVCNKNFRPIGHRRDGNQQADSSSLPIAGIGNVLYNKKRRGACLDLPGRNEGSSAAGLIHTDFEQGFIRAEVITFDDFLFYKSEAACREAGKISAEGKNYVVRDGDIIHFLFSR